jgi:hypothetical protein
VDAYKQHWSEEVTNHNAREQNWVLIQEEWEKLEKQMEQEILRCARGTRNHSRAIRNQESTRLKRLACWHEASLVVPAISESLLLLSATKHLAHVVWIATLQQPFLSLLNEGCLGNFLQIQVEVCFYAC